MRSCFFHSFGSEGIVQVQATTRITKEISENAITFDVGRISTSKQLRFAGILHKPFGF